MYNRESPISDPDSIATLPSSGSVVLTGSSTRSFGGGGRGLNWGRQGSRVERSVTGCRRALFAIDPKNADGRLYMILQLSKVLQGEPEKVGPSQGTAVAFLYSLYPPVSQGREEAG